MSKNGKRESMDIVLAEKQAQAMLNRGHSEEEIEDRLNLAVFGLAIIVEMGIAYIY